MAYFDEYARNRDRAEFREQKIIEKIAKEAGFTDKQIEVLKKIRSMYIENIQNPK